MFQVRIWIKQGQILSHNPHNWQSPHLATRQDLALAQTIARVLYQLRFLLFSHSCPLQQLLPLTASVAHFSTVQNLILRCHSNNLIDLDQNSFNSVNRKKIKSIFTTSKMWATHPYSKNWFVNESRSKKTLVVDLVQNSQAPNELLTTEG